MFSYLHRTATAWLILAASLIVTFIGWRVSLSYVEARAEQRFTFAADEAEFLIRERMLEYEQVLRGGVGLVSIATQVHRDDWRRYVELLQVQKYFPGIQGIGFSRVLSPDQVPAFERRIRAEGFPDFAVTPAGDRPTYTSIEFLEPFDTRNQRAFGYDMFSHPVRRAAMERARDTGDPAMTSRVILLQEIDTDIQPGVLTYLPVYTGGTTPPTLTARRDQLIGYVYAPFRLRDLMNGILDHTRREIEVTVFDGTETTPDNFLYSTTPNALAAAPPRFQLERQATISGQPWILRFTSNENFETATTNYLSTLVAGTGVAIDVLLFLIIATLGNRFRAERASAAAAAAEVRRYARLQTAILQNAGSSIIATDPDGTIVEFNPAAEHMLGYTAEEIIGRQTPAILHDPAEVATRAAQLSVELGEMIEPGFRVFVVKSERNLPNTHEWTYVRKDGTTFPALLSVTVLRDEQGRITGYLGIAQDITERHEAMAKLSTSLEEKEVLLREVHHRVKNNMQLISSLLNLQSGYINDPAALSVFREGQQRIRTMALVHEMLYARNSLAHIQIDVYLSELAQSLRRNAPDAASIQLDLQLEPLSLQPEKAIPLGLIVNELITNACKHAHPAESPLTISIHLHSESANRAVLTFADDGPGLPPAAPSGDTPPLGLRLVQLLARQLRADFVPPGPGEPARYQFSLTLDSLSSTS